MIPNADTIESLLDDLTACGRVDLLARLEVAVRLSQRILRDHDAMLENLTATQKRCTELLDEVRQYRKETARQE